MTTETYVPRTPPGQRSLCEGISDAYSIGLHSGAIVAVLFASLIGTLLPLVTLYVPLLRENPFVFVVAKTAATGVLLSVSTIHLLGDGISAFEEPCIPADFYNAYPAYHLLFMLVAALAMHYVDLKMVAVGERWMRRRRRRRAEKRLTVTTATTATTATASMTATATLPTSTRTSMTMLGDGSDKAHCDEDGVEDKSSSSSRRRDNDNKKENCARHMARTPYGGGGVSSSAAVAAHECCAQHSPTSVAHDEHSHVQGSASACQAVHCQPEATAARSAATAHNNNNADDCVVCDAVRAMDASTCDCTVRAVSATATTATAAAMRATTPRLTTAAVAQANGMADDNDSHDDDDDVTVAHEGCGGHSHGIVVPPEDMSQLRRVIAAVCMEFGVTLHSLFVGLDIGLATDASLKPLLVALVFHQLFEGMSMGSRLVDAKFNVGLEVGLALVFSFSAPLGMAAATIAASVRPDAMAGTGFVLMMAVLDSMCAGILLYLAFNLLFIDFDAEMRVHCAPGLPRRGLKRCVMFISLWSGMLLMALIGKWC